MNVTRFVTAPSDINKVKETHSDDELNRLLEAVNQNCPTRIVLGSVEKGKETPLMASCLRTTPERISVEEIDEIKFIQNPSEQR
ncbi:MULTISPECIES: hypothetical protein [Enterobacteriaceae]|nr:MULTISPECIES: hypothetical protein [Enterobacteriaceae]EDX4236166.1 hypothetical protein [Salmonella enterica subsp. enterica serovar Javiana]EFW3063848.1 hypothetical protein [Shigella sonnei]HBY2375829.1 hypothetical protein [Klebsiella pneumoniae]ANJ42745.1 hypothetical protein A9Z04_24685 [Escherichia coli]AVZ61019.1 hypothetical protein DBZ19_26085 [Escherichia coli]